MSVSEFFLLVSDFFLGVKILKRGNSETRPLGLRPNGRVLEFPRFRIFTPQKNSETEKILKYSTDALFFWAIFLKFLKNILKRP